MKDTGPVAVEATNNLFTESFKVLEDPRRTTKGYFYYPLDEILFLCISAVLSGMSSWLGIETFWGEKLPWLRKFFPYENGTPSHDVLGKLFARLDNGAFNECFASWANSVSELAEGETVPIDGKTIRGSGKGGVHKALHIVSAYATQNGLSLGQVATDEKSNEITAIPKLLGLLSIKGCTVTSDAMGCQKEIAEKIASKGADYILMVKENQPGLMGQVKKLFRIARPNDSNAHVDCGHGRIETRVCETITDLRFLDGKEEWTGLQTVVRIKSERCFKQSGKAQNYERYYISSSAQGAEKFNKDIRSHWAIENNLHWNLDIVFKEDNGLKKNGNSAANFNIIAKIALAMLEKEQSTKASKPMKRARAAFSDSYREKLIGP